MIKKVKIENYKSVVNQTLELGSFNVVIGANGCGKSNLLEAIAMAGLSSSGALLPEMFESRGIRLSESRFMRSAFEEVDKEFITLQVETSDGDESLYRIHYNTDQKPAQWEDVIEEGTRTMISFIKDHITDPSQEAINSDPKLAILKYYFERMNNGDSAKALNFTFKENPDHTLTWSRPNMNGLRNFIIYSLEESSLRSLDTMPSTKLGRTGKGLLPEDRGDRY